MSLQEDFKDACESSGEVTFRNNYSGRGMYGRQCIGIVGDIVACQLVIAQVIKDLGWRISRVSKESIDPDYSASPEDLDETMQDYELKVEHILQFRQDDMGLNVILYWPNLEPIDEENLDIELHDADFRED
jgi:hypothetical protein